MQDPEQAKRERARVCRAARKHYLKKKFNMTPEEAAAHVEGVCSVCGQPETVVWRGSVKSLAIDHDHVTGAVRGSLCMSCNLLLGHAHDNVTTLRAAVRYLEDYSR